MSSRLHKAILFGSLPHHHGDTVLPSIQRLVNQRDCTIFVLDDDPTGTQTVYDIPILTEWSVETLVTEMQRQTSTVYILTNSRSLTSTAAQQLSREIGQNLQTASAHTGRKFSVVSRSDSTLRGHYPPEVDVLSKSLKTNFDNLLLIPAFFEGGRYTIQNVHYVAEDEWLTPAGQTEFAKDASFGYSSSDLCEWVEEKTNGAIRGVDVASISIDTIRSGGADAVTQQLLQLSAGKVCVINAVDYQDLEIATLGIMQAETQGKHYLFRTAASFVRTYSGLDAQPLLKADDLTLHGSGGGLIVVGSYVERTSKQLQQLLDHSDIVPIEINVGELLSENGQIQTVEYTITIVNDYLADGRDVVIFTSRGLITDRDEETSLSIGNRVSESLVNIVMGLENTPRYIIAKGGITSSDIATKGLSVQRATVRGQILPGIPVWELGEDSRFSGMSYIVFPGNVGDEKALMQIVNQLSRQEVM